MDLGLTGKVALVTAASKGIGKAVGFQLAREGAFLSICARGQEALLRAAEGICSVSGMEAYSVQADITSRSDRERVVEETMKRFGRIDILVNNCGSPVPVPVGKISLNSLEDTLNLVLLSMVDFCLRVIPSMRAKNWGRIINIASVLVKEPLPDFALSSTIRPTVVGFSKCLADDVARDNVTVNVVCPGFTMTETVEKLADEFALKKNLTPEEIYTQWASMNPMRRLANPDEIASVVAFLASERASYVTGTTIAIDGGMTRGVA